MLEDFSNIGFVIADPVLCSQNSERASWNGKITFKYKATLGGQLIASATHLSFFLWNMCDCVEHSLAQYQDKDQILAFLTGLCY